MRRLGIGLLISISLLLIVGLGYFGYRHYRLPKNIYVTPPWKGKFYCNVKDTVFGIDVSKYNGDIDWALLKQENPEVSFAFIRCTMGPKKSDYKYGRNLAEASMLGVRTGAYHYYWANLPGEDQFRNFKAHVQMSEHELRPVLDIEKPSKLGDDYLRRELKHWIDLAEQEYGVMSWSRLLNSFCVS